MLRTVRRILSGGIAASALLITAVAAADESAVPSAPVRVAVFQDSGVSKNSAGLVVLLKRYPDLKVETLSAEAIRGGKLAGQDVVVFPGGSGSKEAAALEPAGRQAVRSFVEQGGGYLGICAGAYLASADYEWSLHILDAKVLDRAHWARGSGDVEVCLAPAAQQLFAVAGERQTILYWQGPLLAPAGKPEIPDYESLGTFATEIAKNGAPRGVMIGTTAIARGTFGAGRVLCFSPHPERTPATEAHVRAAIRWAAKREALGSQ